MAKLLRCPDGNLVEFTGEIKHDTGSAILVIVEDTGEEVWIPRSQVEEIESGNSVISTIIVKEWIAKEKGII